MVKQAKESKVSHSWYLFVAVSELWIDDVEADKRGTKL